MSYVPDFENDLFISYAHIDNLPLTEGQKGWIENFHYSLEVRLQQLLGEKLAIWRDKKLQGNDYFSDTLLEKLPKVAVLVSILSPRYLKSDWCLKELRGFLEQSGGVRLKDKLRVFKVVKTYVPLEEQRPQELQRLLGYEFYQVDQSTGRPREFFFDPQDSDFKNCRAKLEDLALDIQNLLETIRRAREGLSESDTAPSGATIYLAETTSDLISERDRIKRELQQRGHTILPDRPLPLNAHDLKEAARAYLERSTLSIHLVGGNYGIVPEGESRSIICLQNEIAATASESRPFTRVLWLPVGLKAKEQHQEEFIAYLQNKSSGQPGVELLQTNIEDLKTFILDRLSRSEEKVEEPIRKQDLLYIYLIYDQGDVHAVRPLRKYLFEKGYEVIPSVLEGDDAKKIHEDNLKQCDAVIIYYGSAKEPWVYAKLGELDKALGYRGSKPMIAKAVYVGAPATIEKEDFSTHKAPVMTNFEAFSPEVLKPFFDQLEKAK